MSEGLKTGLIVAAVAVVGYFVLSQTSSAAALIPTPAVAVGQPLAISPGSPIVSPPPPPSRLAAVGEATGSVLKVGVQAPLAIATLGLSTSSGRAVYSAVGHAIGSTATSIYHGIASIF